MVQGIERLLLDAVVSGVRAFLDISPIPAGQQVTSGAPASSWKGVTSTVYEGFLVGSREVRGRCSDVV